MKKILMITTGGTIASASGAEGLAPLGVDEILSHMAGASDSFDLSIREIMTLDSSNIQPEEWKIIASAIFEGYKNHDGIVVTHGTDTMAYTSSMMCFMLKNPPIPVVFTGSQVPISEPLTDAVLNLRCAFAMAGSGVAGIFVAFDRKIILGCRAVKVRTTAFDAFESVNCPVAGVIDAGGLRLSPQFIPSVSGAPALEDNLDTNIFLLKLTPGTNPNIIDMLIGSNCRGIVIEAFGSGGLQFIRRDFVSKIENATKAGIPVVICSQCLYEKSELSIYQVGQKALEKGAIQGFDMTSEAAVTKLMWALGKTKSLPEIKKIFAENLAGELGK